MSEHIGNVIVINDIIIVSIEYILYNYNINLLLINLDSIIHVKLSPIHTLILFFNSKAPTFFRKPIF